MAVFQVGDEHVDLVPAGLQRTGAQFARVYTAQALALARCCENPKEDWFMTVSRPRDWNDHWRGQGPTSFGDFFPSNYDGTILDFWQAQLAGQIEAVVDIACGNGALVWIADEILNKEAPTASVTGVDFADIDPFAALAKQASDYPLVRFIGNTAAEQLPFADESVDLVVSQYGIEYTNLDESIPEVMRILKPNGRMAFIMHNSRSSVVAVATERLDDMKAVYALGIHDLALQLNELGRRLPTPEQRRNSREIREIALNLDALTNHVREMVRGYRSRSAIHRYMESIIGVFANEVAGNVRDDADLAILKARDKLHAIINRNEHMRAAVMTTERLDRMVGLIEQSGGALTERFVIGYRHEENVGTALVAIKSGSD